MLSSFVCFGLISKNLILSNSNESDKGLFMHFYFVFFVEIISLDKSPFNFELWRLSKHMSPANFKLSFSFWIFIFGV